MSMEKQSYENAINELHHILNDLQDEMVSVDDLSVRVNRAAELIDWCKMKLRNTETELENIFKEEV